METIWTRYGADAEAALAAAVAAAQAQDPLAPVHVIAPNRYAALAARRALAARPCGLANVRCEPLERIADLLATPGLIAAGRRPLGSARWAQAIRTALAPSPATTGTLRAYERAFADLRHASPDAYAAMAEADPRATTTIERYHAARHAVAGAFDAEDALHAAAAIVRAAPAVRAELGAITIWLTHDATPGERALLVALATTGPCTMVFARTGDPEADAPVLALAAALGAQAPDPEAPDADGCPPHVTLRRAPDPDEEVRAALRAILDDAQSGGAFHEHAIFVRDLEPYGRIVHEQAAAAGIPIAGPESRHLADTVIGRFLLTMLTLDPATMHRDEYVAWLASAPIIDPAHNARIRALRWDTITRAAGIVADGATFVPALDAYIAQRTTDREGVPKDDIGTGKRNAIARDIDDARALAAFTTVFLEVITDTPQRTFADWVAWCRTQLRTYLGSDARRAAWPDAEHTAAVRIDTFLDALAELDGPPVERAAFADALTLELDAPCDALGRFGTGVFVGRVSDAIGTAFGHVTILGVSDGVFPGSRRDDALLPDHVRAIGELPTRALRRHDERHAFLAAVAAGTRTVCSFATADPRRQRAALPSRWLVQWAASRAGTPVGAAALRTMAATDWLEVVPSFTAGVAAQPALHLDGARLAALAAHPELIDVRIEAALDTDHDDLAHALAAARSRTIPECSPYQGGVGAHPRILESDQMSPTSLETWARCPRAFFFSKVLGLDEIQKPEALDVIRADERGSLVHRVLERFLAEARPRTGPTDAWDADDRARLDAIFGEECDARAANGRTGRPVRWLLEQRRLRRHLHAFLDRDDAQRAATGMVPLATEMAFGFRDSEVPPVALAGVELHGVADRVDVTPDAAGAAVYDYKTGSPGPYKRISPDDPTLHGTRLQLPAYALAAQARTGATDVRAAYWFIGDDPDPTFVSLDLTSDVMAAYTETVATIAEGINDGVFPAVPGDRGFDGFAHCTYCPFDRICPSDRDRTWEAVQLDPRTAPYHALNTKPDGDA